MTSALRRVAVSIAVLAVCTGLVLLIAGDPRGARATPIAPQPPDASDPTALPPAKKGPTNVVRQGFPAAGADSDDLTKSETAWEVEWELTHPENRPFYPPGSVMRIKSAKFMWKDRAGKPNWVVVARMLEPAEIYVPYDNGNTAFLDIHDMPFHITPARKEFLGPSCVLPGEILDSANKNWANTVHKEVHDDGIRWMSAETGGRNQVGDRARRGEKMMLWATYYGANYRYLLEYTFADDGQLTCRIGPTARNIFNRQPDQGDVHLHIGCWRFEPDLGDALPGPSSVAAQSKAASLGGPSDNDILLARRVYDERADRFIQVAKPFSKNGLGEASEGSARWVPEEFTTLRVASRSRKNAHGRPISYDLIPLRYGALRQLQPEGGSRGANMDWINYDFWVTRTEPGFTSYIDVAQYASQHRPLTGHPTTIWTCTPAIHVPRTEDFGTADGNTSYMGVAITTWTGFTLKPRDLFDGTPLYDPPKPLGRRFFSQ
jgi:hypothetical protein